MTFSQNLKPTNISTWSGFLKCHEISMIHTRLLQQVVQHGGLSVIYHSMWNTAGRSFGCAYTMQHVIYLNWQFAAKFFPLQCLWPSGVKCIAQLTRQTVLISNGSSYGTLLRIFLFNNICTLRLYVSNYLLDKNYTVCRSHCDITSLKMVQTSLQVLIPVECVSSLSNR